MIFAKNNKVILRPLSEADIEDFLAYRSDPLVCRYQGFEPYTKEKAIAFLQTHNWIDLQRKGEWMQMAIVGQQDGDLLGDAALRFLEYQPQIAEVGCTLSQRYQGQGFAHSAMQLLLSSIFKQTNVHKVNALMDERNTAAVHLVEKLGFKREAHFRQSYFDKIDDAWMGEYQYGLIKSEAKALLKWSRH